MAETGWVNLNRSIQDCFFWNDREPFDRRSAWMYLLLKANYSDGHIMVSGIVVDVPRGSLITSENKLMSDWKWSKNRVRLYLKQLVDLNMIEVDTCKKWTRINLVNYGICENFQTTEEPQKDHRRTTEEPQKDHNIKKKESNNIESNKERTKDNNNIFVPPTVDEVRAYCQEKGYGIDAQYFCDYYAADNWHYHKGSERVKMKSWKQTLVTWNRKRTGGDAKQSDNGYEQETISEFGSEFYTRPEVSLPPQMQPLKWD